MPLAEFAHKPGKATVEVRAVLPTVHQPELETPAKRQETTGEGNRFPYDHFLCSHVCQLSQRYYIEVSTLISGHFGITE